MLRAVVELCHADPIELAPKAAALARLSAAGLPVPDAVVIDLGPRADPRWPAALHDPALARLLAAGPVIVRSASMLEDTDSHSGAGLGLSIPHRRTLAEVRDAIARIDAHRGSIDAIDDGARDQVIVQRQIARRVLVAVADHAFGVDVQIHEHDDDALERGSSPTWTGPLSAWTDPAAAAIAEIVARVRATLPASAHGRELEIVVDADDRAHVVQARPLVAEIHEGAAELLAEARARDPSIDLSGRLELDAEHNPAPLSPAHAWLMGELRRERPQAGDPTVLAGWLYVRVLPRSLPADRSGRSAADVLATLWHVDLPNARARLDAIVHATAVDDRHAIAAAFDPAIRAFFAMIDTYLREIVPARARARAQGLGATADPEDPLSLRARDRFLDVLPASWDLAAPSLHELGLVARSEPDTPPPRDEATAATLLGEWDDHLFSLGLAPLRHVIRRAGAVLGLGDDAFLLTPPELCAWLTAAADPASHALIDDRRAALQRAAALRPPLVLYDGRPVLAAALGRLRGIPIGPSFHGVITPRRDLADLLARPPSPDAIVTLPALTAQAAVALHHTGVRAVCCEHGGALSHAALMARELALSALIGCRGCTDLPAGRRAHLDTTTARLRPT